MFEVYNKKNPFQMEITSHTKFKKMEKRIFDFETFKSISGNILTLNNFLFLIKLFFPKRKFKPKN